MPALPILVQKYGGSSVADVAALGRVAQAIVARAREGYALVVVVSAMGKSTDALLAQARSVAVVPPQRELDMLMTAGERISMALLTMAIINLGCDAKSFTGSQSGIITDDQHQGAHILEVRPRRLLQALQDGQIVICAGYQGVSLQGEVTTLGRGGSDTSAVALAAALGAQACEIYSDVDGVYSSDPNVCPQARLLPEVPYETMHTMASFGARVLNADAVRFAQAAGIEVLARQTGDPSPRQTRLFAGGPKARGPVAVTACARAAHFRGAAAHLPQSFFTSLRHCGARLMLSGPGDVLADTGSMAAADDAPLLALAAQHRLILHDVAAVTLVGGGMLGAVYEGWLAEIGAAAPSARAFMGSDGALVALVERAHVDAATRSLHARYCEAT